MKERLTGPLPASRTSRRRFLQNSVAVGTAAAACGRPSMAWAAQAAATAADATGFRPLFDGRDLAGWVPSTPSTWTVRDGTIICSGHPDGLLRSDRQYENFVLQVDWRHMEPGGNSGLYVWSDPPAISGRWPKGVEIQILELDWVKLQTRDGNVPPIAYVHGELIPVGGLTFVPDTPRGPRSMSVENRAKGRGEWNNYTVVAVSGTIKLAVNGKFVNGLSQASQKKGYLALQSEGAEIHFRNLQVLELPPGVLAPSEIAPEAS